jgi:hypothetical protein
MGCSSSSPAPSAAPAPAHLAVSDTIQAVEVDALPVRAPKPEQLPSEETKDGEPLGSPILAPPTSHEATPNHQPSCIWASNENLVQERKEEASTAVTTEKQPSKLTYSSMGLVGAEKIIGFLSACALDDVDDVEAFLNGDTWIESRDKVSQSPGVPLQ